MGTHDVDEAVLLPDRIVMMTNGGGGNRSATSCRCAWRVRATAWNWRSHAHIEYRTRVLEFLYHRQATCPAKEAA